MLFKFAGFLLPGLKEFCGQLQEKRRGEIKIGLVKVMRQHNLQSHEWW
jgi:hypothetical protein